MKRILIRYAKVFGMKIFMYEKREKIIKLTRNVKFVSLKKFDCKFITIHIPLDGNESFFSKKEIFKILKKAPI